MFNWRLHFFIRPNKIAIRILRSFSHARTPPLVAVSPLFLVDVNLNVSLGNQPLKEENERRQEGIDIMAILHDLFVDYRLLNEIIVSGAKAE